MVVVIAYLMIGVLLGGAVDRIALREGVYDKFGMPRPVLLFLTVVVWPLFVFGYVAAWVREHV